MKLSILLSSLFTLTTISSFAQVSYNFKAGVGLPTWSHKNREMIIENDDVQYGSNYEKSKTGTVTSFYINANASYNLKSNFAVQAGIGLEGRGGRIPQAEYKANYMFVNVPVNLLYYIPTGPIGSAFVSAGPYAGINFGGKYTASNGEGGTYTEDMDYGKNMQLKRFDWGINWGVGYKFTKGYIISANYNLGLYNMGTLGQYEKLHSRGFSFGIGYEI